MRSLIIGIGGQDGSYLAEHLLEQGDKVFGIVRRNSTPEHQEGRISHLGDKVTTYYGDVMDRRSLDAAIIDSYPDKIFNLAAQSHVRISFDVPELTVQTTAVGVLNVLESFRIHAPEARFYQASSSEMFGNSQDPDGYQRETTPMNPTSPYGCAKVFGYNLTRHYRNAYGLFACNGILFNHESPRRGSNFVTNKVVRAAVAISKHQQSKLEMGNLDSARDWGHSKDYVRAMNLILQHEEPDDFVVATGKANTVRHLCSYAFGVLGLRYQDYVEQNPRYVRPEELEFLRGDSTKIRVTLGWLPEYDFESLIDEMIEHWQGIL